MTLYLPVHNLRRAVRDLMLALMSLATEAAMPWETAHGVRTVVHRPPGP